MKPSITSHVLRRIVKGLADGCDIDHSGLYSKPPLFPTADNPDLFREQWMIYNIARKRVIDTPDTEEAARAAFYASEAKCYAIERDGLFSDQTPVKDKWFLLRVRQILLDLLGEAPPADWYSECEFTGGASTSRKRSESHPSLKWTASGPLHVTPLALPHLLRFKKSCEVIDSVWDLPGNIAKTSDYGPARNFFTVVPGSNLRFVEKNYRTKRTILIEPDGNMLLQKGIGNIIRRLLRRVGINLNSQRYNQILAYAGSISGSVGTVDVEAASDSVTLALLRLVLPWRWYELIYELRSPCFNDNGTWHTMRKVSSMGNGFTFELESAVFYAIAKATIGETNPVDTRIAVFGDDIIIASESCARLSETLSLCGFKVNTEKSFWEGSFRESCGKHYYSGADVTPVYVKENLDCLSSRFRLYNQLRTWAGGVHFDPRYSQILDSVLDTIPIKDRRQVPVEFGSRSGIHYPDVCTSRIRETNSHRGNTLKFAIFDLVREDWTDRYEDEVIWLYRHMARWQHSCPLGTREYTPLRFIRETGERVWSTVSIPYSSVTRLIA